MLYIGRPKVPGVPSFSLASFRFLVILLGGDGVQGWAGPVYTNFLASRSFGVVFAVIHTTNILLHGASLAGSKVCGGGFSRGLV